MLFRSKQAVRFAAECGAPVVNTDEGPKAVWTTEAEDFVLMRYTLMEAARVAEPRGVLLGIEPHQQYSKHPDGLDRIHALVRSPSIGINFDTGNSYLCGHDPYAWLERVIDRCVHIHAKDISDSQSAGERGKIQLIGSQQSTFYGSQLRAQLRPSDFNRHSRIAHRRHDSPEFIHARLQPLRRFQFLRLQIGRAHV